MTYNPENTAIERLTELLVNGQDDRFSSALELLLNAAMLIEQRDHIKAEPCQGSEERNGQANGYKERSLSTRLGELTVRIPQVRGSEKSAGICAQAR